MIRTAALIWFLLILAVSTGLYVIKHQVQALESELNALNRAVLREQEAIHVLEAEWSYLNRPEALATLAQRHLDLAPLTGAQISPIERLPFQLAPRMPRRPWDAEPDAPRLTAAEPTRRPTNDD